MDIGQKICGPLRNCLNIVKSCGIRSYVSTARKNGLYALDALQRLFLGVPFLQAVTVNDSRSSFHGSDSGNRPYSLG